MIERVIDARSAELGGGLTVARVLPFRERRMVGPFIFLDHAGPLVLPAPIPQAMDVRPHPHIGLSTVTYGFDGAWIHRDSIGFEQVIRPGDVNWMTAGRGVSHSERLEGRFREAGGPLEMLQAWVALPEAAEEDEPTFHHHPQSALPILDEGGVWARLIAGQALGLASPVSTHSPLFYVHAELASGARIEVPREPTERAVYVVRGQVEVGGRPFQAGQMVVFDAGTSPVVTALAPARVMLLGGEPLGPRHIWWNFVSSRKERIEQAKADWKAGRFVLPVNDDQEFIALP